MILGVIFNIGESLTTLKAAGQDKRFINYYLRNYLKEFDKVYLFSYAKENYRLPRNAVLISNRFKFHRFFYAFLMPILHFKEFRECDIFRVTHLLGSIPAIIAKLFWGKKSFVTYGYDYKNFSRLERKSYLIPLISVIEFLSFKLADGIIVTNKQIQDYVLRGVKKDKVFYIPNGVDIRLFKPKPKTKNQKPKTKIILFVGRLEKQKNLFVLIKAVDLLKNKKPVVLKFIGEGSLKNDLKRYAEKLGINLQIIKKVSYDKMPQIYQEANVFVLPSLVEGHPKALLEAMACGLPCVGNNIKSIKTIIIDEKNGLIFNKKAVLLKKKLEQVLGNERLAQKLGRNARAFIKKNFDFNKLIKKEIKILQHLP